MSSTLTAATAVNTRLHVAARVAAAVLGSYVLAWGVAAALTSLLNAAGLEFHDAEFLGVVAVLLSYLVAFLWAIAARRLAWVWGVMLAGGALLAGLGSYVQSLLV